jgi:hypothetical protein
MSDDIAGMRAELALRDQRIAELEGELRKLKPAPRVLKVGDPFVLPDIEMVQRLVERVLGRHHELHTVHKAEIDRGDIKPDEYVGMVRASMLFAASLYRTRGTTNKRKSALDWIYDCQDHCTLVGHGCTTVRGSAFFVGCICSGDIPFLHPRSYPLWEVGLAVGPAGDRYPATNQWLRVATGEFNESLIIEPPRPLHSPATHDIGRNIGWRQQL